MVKNMGSADRIIRTLLAAAVVGLYYTNMISGTMAIVLGMIAGIFLFTSLISFCPLYRLIGASTCSVKK